MSYVKVGHFVLTYNKAIGAYITLSQGYSLSPGNSLLAGTSNFPVNVYIMGSSEPLGIIRKEGGEIFSQEFIIPILPGLGYPKIKKLRSKESPSKDDALFFWLGLESMLY